MATSMQQEGKLALFGGIPVREQPLPRWPHFSEDEIATVGAILRSGDVNYWTGSECTSFETEFAEYHGVRYGCALANGTLALELALRVLGIGSGDEVIVTPRSFFASASSIALAGAVPIFADVDSDSQNITVDTISAAVTDKTRAILVVHLAGWPCDMPAIMEFARERGLAVIEDCAQALGAKIGEKFVGSFGDVAAFSFCQDKIMSTGGEGGMLLTNDRSLWSAAWSFKDHGKSWDRVHEPQEKPGFRWLHESLGSNWRTTEMQAAIGRLQLQKLSKWVQTRRANADRLIAALAGHPALRIPVPAMETQHSYYRLYAFIEAQALAAGWTRDRILAALRAEGIPGLSGTCAEIYREQAFGGDAHDGLPVAKTLGETSLALLVHPTLEPRDIDDISRALIKVLDEAIAHEFNDA